MKAPTVTPGIGIEQTLRFLEENGVSDNLIQSLHITDRELMSKSFS